MGRSGQVGVLAAFFHGGEQFATGDGHTMIISPPAYRRIRESSRADCEDTTILTQPRLPRVHVDRNHPVYFDHHTDHVPGMLLVDAACRAVQHRLSSTAEVVGFEATFDGFVELEPTTFMKLSLNEQDARVCLGRPHPSPTPPRTYYHPH